MHVIDGHDGGGQVLRTALTCALVTGEAVRVERVRGARSTPGLRPQHLAGLHLATAVGAAEVSGAHVGSETVAFSPTARVPGDHRIDVGTAGSLTLLCDVVLPLAPVLDAPLTVTATGGTDVRWAPLVGYLRHVKLPLLARAGLDATLTIERHGFYPTGGGRIRLTVEPGTLSPFVHTDRPPRGVVAAYSVASTHLRGANVADRQAATAGRALRRAGHAVEPHVRYVPADCPGSSLLLVATDPDGLPFGGASTLGEKGVPAERVALDATERLGEWLAGPGAVDPHLADQLMLPVALAGGAVSIPRVTDHVRTNRAVIEAFGADLAVEERADGVLLTCDDPLL